MYDGRDIKKALSPLALDNTSGSVKIAMDAVALIRDILVRTDAASFGGALRLISRQLIGAQPSMGIILNLAYRLRSMAGTSSAGEVMRYLDAFGTMVDAHTARIAERMEKPLVSSARVMTWSSSSTVLASLRNAWDKGLRFKVIVTESRPVNEGAQMMKALLKSSIPVTYTTDAAGMSMLAQGGIDTVLIGADALFKRNVVCKTGSLAIAALCKAKKVRLYGLCGTEKRIPGPLLGTFVIADKPAKEITGFKHRSLTVANRYFERIPSSLFTKIVTD